MRAGGWLAASCQAVLQISSRDDITLFPTSGNGWQKWARLGCLWGGGANKATAGQVNVVSAACLALLEPGTPQSCGQQEWPAASGEQSCLPAVGPIRAKLFFVGILFAHFTGVDTKEVFKRFMGC